MAKMQHASLKLSDSKTAPICLYIRNSGPPLHVVCRALVTVSRQVRMSRDHNQPQAEAPELHRVDFSLKQSHDNIRLNDPT